MRLRHRALFLDGFGPNPFGSQEPGHAMLTNCVPPLDQDVPNAGTAVGSRGILGGSLGFPKAGYGCAPHGERAAHEPDEIAAAILAKHAAARCKQSRFGVTRARSMRVSSSAR